MARFLATGGWIDREMARLLARETNGGTMNRGWLLAVLALAAAPIGSAASPGSSVGTIPLEGVIKVGAGTTTVGDGIGAAWGGGDLPLGVLGLPERVDEVVIELTVDGDLSRDARYVLRACEGDCREGDVIGEIVGRGELSLAVSVEDVDEVGWLVLPVDGQQMDVAVHGSATLFTATSGEGTRAAAEPTTEEGSRAFGLPSWVPLEVFGGLALTAAGRWLQRTRGWNENRLPLVKDGRDLLEDPTRQRIYEAVHASPGIHHNELQRELGVGHGTLAHHLDQLLDAGLVRSVRLRGYRCLFPPDIRDEDPGEAARALRSGKARRMLASVVREPAHSNAQLADRLDIPPSTVSYHVRALEEVGLVERGSEGGGMAVAVTERGRWWTQRLGLTAD